MDKGFYLDASALAKRYAAETGTPLVNHLFRRVPRANMISLTLGTLEVVSIFVRKKNAHRLSLSALNQALADFKSEVIDAPDFTKVEATDALVNAAAALVQRYSINATDAVVLRSALDARTVLRAAGTDLVLVTSDQRLIRASQAEGLVTFDPETQSQADRDALIGP